jgi:hypothetical protein
MRLEMYLDIQTHHFNSQRLWIQKQDDRAPVYCGDQEVITGRSRDTASGGREGLRPLISLFGRSFGMLQKCVL